MRTVEQQFVNDRKMGALKLRVNFDDSEAQRTQRNEAGRQY